MRPGRHHALNRKTALAPHLEPHYRTTAVACHQTRYAGTQQRATDACIGERVNLAARLEAHTKTENCSILVDYATYATLSSDTDATELPKVAFKGFSDPLAVYRIEETQGVHLWLLPPRREPDNVA